MANGSTPRLYGVDFSGARTAGEKIWIASGRIEDGRLVVERCRSAVEAFGDRDRKAVLEALRAFVVERPESLFGFDFPFGLPEAVTDEPDWRTFVERFGDSFDGPTDLRETCTERAEGHRRRVTDELAAALCPYDIRIQYQTYYGIGALLRPLVAEEAVSVFPMTSEDEGRPGVIEVYPAATLDRHGLHRNGYKTETERAEQRRERNLDGLIECVDLSVDESVRDAVVADSEGDALDSVVAACAAFRAVREDEFRIEALSTPAGFDTLETDGEYHEHAAMEGHIYV